MTPSCKELSFRQNDYSVSRGEWRWWYWNCLQILWHFSLKFPPLKYVLASVTDFYWTESGETDFCSVGKPTLSINYYTVKKPRPHTEHLVSAPTDHPQLMTIQKPAPTARHVHELIFRWLWSPPSRHPSWCRLEKKRAGLIHWALHQHKFLNKVRLLLRTSWK